MHAAKQLYAHEVRQLAVVLPEFGSTRGTYRISLSLKGRTLGLFIPPASFFFLFFHAQAWAVSCQRESSASIKHCHRTKKSNITPAYAQTHTPTPARTRAQIHRHYKPKTLRRFQDAADWKLRWEIFVTPKSPFTCQSHLSDTVMPGMGGGLGVGLFSMIIRKAIAVGKIHSPLRLSGFCKNFMELLEKVSPFSA